MIFILGKDFDILKIYGEILNPEYRKEVSSIIERFNEIKRKSRSFNSLKTPNEKLLLFPVIKEFLNVTKKYVNIDIVYDPCVCPECLCLMCDCKKAVKIKTKNEYEDEENFIRSLMKYQGKQSKKIDFGKLKILLDNSFTKYGFPIGEKIRNGECGNFVPSVMRMNDTLQKIEMSGLYEDVNLICHEYWGFPLPNIEEHMERLIEDYRKTQKVYLELEKMRKSCLNLQYRIFKHLQLLNLNIRQEDFRIPGTPDILKYHDHLWKQMCEGSGLVFIPTI